MPLVKIVIPNGTIQYIIVDNYHFVDIYDEKFKAYLVKEYINKLIGNGRLLGMGKKPKIKIN